MRGIVKVVIGGLIVLAVVIAATNGLNLLLHRGGSKSVDVSRSSTDPFLGTWVLAPVTRLVITKVPNGYLAVNSQLAASTIPASPVTGRLLCKRRGDKLEGAKLLGGLPPAVDVTITYDAATDRLTYASAAEGTYTLNRLASPGNPLATKTSSTGGRHDATFVSRTFHFAISYDPSRFEASPHPMPAGEQFDLLVFLRQPLAGLNRYDDFVYVTTARTTKTYVRARVKTWGTGDLLWDMLASDANTRRWTTFAGARALRLEYSSPTERKVTYLLFAGDEAYAVDMQADPRDWTHAVATLGPVLRSFRLTP